MTNRSRAILAAFALWLAALACALPAAAGTITFERWADTLQVNPDGTLVVTETLTVRFTVQRQGITRSIPLEYHTNEGFDYRLDVRVESVTDGDLRNLRYEQNQRGGNLNLKIYVPGAYQATRTVVLKYRVENGLRFFQDHDELYWNVTGTDHDNTIEETEARVELPAGASGVRTRAFTGRAGATGSNADITQTPDGVIYHTPMPLRAGEGMTIVTGWDKGLVAEPSGASKAWDFLTSNWPLGIPVAALFFAIWFYFAHGRDPALRPLAVQYAPPQGMSPAGAGALMDDSADMRDITATIVDLAVRGYVKIEELGPTGLLKLGSSKDYVFHRLKTRDKWGDLRPHEQALMGALFGGEYGQEGAVRLADLHNSFYKNLQMLRDSIFSELMLRSYYRRRPDTMHQTFTAGALAAGFGIFFLGRLIEKHTGMQILPFVISAVLTAVIVFLYGRAVHARTLEGTRALEGVLGFKEFLARVESDRYNLAVKTPAMFEKFLPYAMAFGCEAHWSKAFDGIYTEPPQWYVGPSYGPRFYPSSFADSLSGMATHAGSVMASAPSSSGSSGFGGGGFSGGGFGGGSAGEF